MARRPIIDYVALPLPTNLQEAVIPAFRTLMASMAERDAMERQIEDLRDRVIAERNRILDTICPVAVGEDLPIAKNVLMQVSERHLIISDTNELHWALDGRRFGFKDGARNYGQKTSIGQVEYDALPEEVKAQTRTAIETSTALVVNLDRPLRWTEPMVAMFDHLKVAVERHLTPGGSVRVPSVTWTSESATRRIYLSMVKQGIVELAPNEKGVLTDPSSALRLWSVRPGPRYAAFVEALDQESQAKLDAARAERDARVPARARSPR